MSMSSVSGLCTAAAIALIGVTPGILDRQTLPRDLGDWQISYEESGGFAPRYHAVSLTRTGDLTVKDGFERPGLQAKASADLIGLVTTYLAKARTAKPTRPGPDQVSVLLTLSTGGRSYLLEPAESVTNALETAGEAAVASALVGAWRESQWKLCMPAAQLSMADMDPPIERLELRADNTYSVTWQGGGAHTTGIPHAAIPDYSGHYSVRPGSGSIQFTYENGLVRPTDFAGAGTFWIADGQLTLEHIWFGTRKATHKPDICQLTFVHP
jgi:hypothetical protein